MLSNGHPEGAGLLVSEVASVPVDISSMMLKGNASTINDHLLMIYNLSFSTGKVSEEWKVS